MSDRENPNMMQNHILLLNWPGVSFKRFAIYGLEESQILSGRKWGPTTDLYCKLNYQKQKHCRGRYVIFIIWERIYFYVDQIKKKKGLVNWQAWNPERKIHTTEIPFIIALVCFSDPWSWRKVNLIISFSPAWSQSIQRENLTVYSTNQKMNKFSHMHILNLD